MPATVRDAAGLHHDFHDNLYVLLRGKKRLRLFPPDLAARMHTHGRVRKVHENGQIIYVGQVRLHKCGGSQPADHGRPRACCCRALHVSTCP